MQKAKRYQALCANAIRCFQCERMEGSNKIIGVNCGSIASPIMFIGEAPGRRGAEQSLIPFKGDKSGDNFEILLSHSGLSRDQIYISNALLCNPKDGGRNGSPKMAEIRNCNPFLESQIEIVDPLLIVTLGGVALKALSLLLQHDIQLKKGVGKIVDWNNRKLMPLFHPGQRAMIHRSFQKQIDDYESLGNWIRNNILLNS